MPITNHWNIKHACYYSFTKSLQEVDSVFVDKILGATQYSAISGLLLFYIGLRVV